MERGDRMEGAREAEVRLREAFRLWFEQRDAAAALGFFHSGIAFTGTGEAERAEGLAEMAAYLESDVREIPEPFSCGLSPLRRQALAEGVCHVSGEVSLKNSVYAWLLRMTAVLVREDGRWMIRTLHISEAGASQRAGEHYPHTLVLENIVRQRQELLDNSLPGGMMGGYLEEGFPFYFVNERMLAYLEYESEADFVSDIGGSISNCMHPDDRAAVDAEVVRQLSEGTEYAVEYRMKKRDGSYIWVHDVGRSTIAENGRPAIISVCIDITAQKKAREELLHIYNSIPGAVFRCRFDADFSVIDANDGLYEFLGYTREEFAALGNNMSAVIYPEDLAAMAEKLNEQLRHGNMIRNENRLVHRSGAVKWISIQAQLVTEEDGEQYFYCVFVDITEEKQLQERVQEVYRQELAYFAEVSATEGSIQGRINVTKNRVESYLATSDVAVAHLGDSYDQTLANLAVSAVDAAYGEKLLAATRRDKVLSDYAAGRTEYRFDFLRRRNGGGAFWGSTSLRTYTNPETGNVIMFFYTFDVTEQRLKERLLERIAELEYESIVDIDLVHDRFHRLASGSTCTNVLPDEGRFQREIHRFARRYMAERDARAYAKLLDYAHMRRRLDEEGPYSFVIEMRGPDGAAQLKRYQVFYIDRDLGRACMARTDVTDVVRQEQRQRSELSAALAAAERANAAKSDFLSTMSHDIRTPLNAIMGMTGIAEAHLGERERVADCLQKISVSSKHLLSLVNDILDMSKIEQGKVTLNRGRVSLPELTEQLCVMMEPQARSAGLQFQVRTGAVAHAYFYSDALRISQVLINLLGNAIKFTPEGGRVEFLTEELPPERAGNARYRFTVRDTGIGMAEDFIGRIFEPFTRSREAARIAGTGLGLSISKALVDLMGGSIAVESRPGEGSAFRVELEFEPAEGGADGAPGGGRGPDRTSRPFAGRRFLVAEDNAINAEILCELLGVYGAAAEVKTDGAQAVEAFREAPMGTYDAVLMDIQMPELNGYEATRAIRGLDRPDAASIPIVAMTANAFAEDVQAALDAGMNAHVAKPLDAAALQAALDRLLPPPAED